MASAVKTTRWSELDAPAKAEQFQRRGIERTARVDSNSACMFCKQPMAIGENYLEINGTRYAHKSCVNSNSNGAITAARKVITNKMREEAAQRKSVPTSVETVPKRGRKPKTQSLKNRTSIASRLNSTSEISLPKKRGRKPKSEWATPVDNFENKKSSVTSKKSKLVGRPARKSEIQAAKSLKTASKPDRKLSAKSIQADRSELRKEMLSNLAPPPIIKLERTIKARTTKVAATKSEAKHGRKPKSQSSAIEVTQPRETPSDAVLTFTISGSLEAIQETLKNLAAGLLNPRSSK
jgi:hypothetical protein